MDHIDTDAEVVSGPRPREFSLPVAHFEGATDLPRVLFARDALDRGGCVVSTAVAEREGEQLALEEVERLGDSVQASIDRCGLREALLRIEGGSALLCRRGGTFEVSVAAADGAAASELAEALAATIRVEPGPRDTRVAVAFWSGPGGDLLSAPGPRWRRLALPRFAAIETNYAVAMRSQLAEFCSRPGGDTLPGRLALWHGPPGTGKTWALRALGREWNEWCDLHYITDPERLLGGDTAYMLQVLAGRSEPLDLDEDDDEARREPEERWRLLVLEDAGELLGVTAPAEIGRGFARLLNIADGLLGQGTRALILVTTNEALGKLHPAALRPGRAMATLQFAPLSAAEASEWLAERGLDRRISSPADVHVAAPAPVGFG